MTYSINDKVKKIRDALISIETVAKIDHYRKPADTASGRYIVWQEDSGDGFAANNRTAELSVTGTIDLYTQTEFDVLIDQIAEALNDVSHISFSVNSVDYDDESNLIHYEYLFTVI